jgi:hypothetical protein
MSDWSAPDEDGIQTRGEGVHPRRRISGRRERRARGGIDVARVIWRKEEIGLLRDLIPPRSAVRTWVTMQSMAGPARVQLLQELTRNLLRAGLIVVSEQKRRGEDWQPFRIEFTDVARIRSLAGLPDLDARAREASGARGYPGRTPPVCELASELADMRDELVVRRAPLLRALDAWIESKRTGTRYDFALFATGHTKGIVRSDWEWLVAHEVLECASIVDHEPILRVAGRWTLHLGPGARVDVGIPAAPGGLAPTTIAAAHAISGVERWVVLENRTVFDHAARISSAGSAILWTPGYSPEWWLSAVRKLVEMAPRPVRIACDPDPAGICIALRAARPWADQSLGWSTVGMSAADLESLTQRAPLTDADRRILDAIPDELDVTLSGLKQALPVKGKGEQEGFFDAPALMRLVMRDAE